MHIPKIFQQTNTKELKDIIVKYPFVNLVTNSESGLEVNHLPFFLDTSDNTLKLQGHIAKANSLWKTLKDQSEVLIVVNGPNCYISPNYYPTKKENGRAVPTWNYVVVHVKGVMSYRHDTEFKLEMLKNLTFQHEKNQSTPWLIEHAPEEYIERMLPAIVGLDIEVLEITGKSKISQNKPDINKKGVIDGLSSLKQEGAQEIAELIRTHHD